MANTLNTVNLPGNITSGSYLVSSGVANGWTSTTIPYTYTTTNTQGYQLSPTITVKNDPASLQVDGKILHNGRDLEERLNTIEKVLAIPERDVKLEIKYPKLKKMHDDYIKELSKYRMWESIKGEEDGK